jgi:hypothetical protein
MDTLDLIYKYKSPSNEASYAKCIPMKYLKQIQEDLKHDNATRVFMNRAFGGDKYRYMFRGKSKLGFKRPQAWCPKPHAETFAIYEKGVNTWLV